jgi:hypothetical protein
MKPYRAPDGTWWGVEVRMPTHSSALLIFHHPTGDTARLNRYAWVNASSGVAQDPRGCLTPATVVAALDDRSMTRLFRRSMPISTDRPTYVVS